MFLLVVIERLDMKGRLIHIGKILKSENSDAIKLIKVAVLVGDEDEDVAL